MARFGSVITAMVTPFDADGRLDVAVAADLARWLVDQGSNGLVLTGTTGESPVLTDDEDVALWTAVRDAVPVPLIAGSGTNDTRHAVELTERATATGVDAVLIVTPYYNRPGQSGLEAHFRAVAAATDLPVLIYDIPVRTGRKVDTETLLRLAHDVPNIVGVKDAAANPPETARLIAEAPDDFEVYSGDDSFTLPLMSVGAVGLIGVATHWAAAEHAEMIAAFQKGDVRTAGEINARLIESHRFETSDATPNPLPTKAMMRVLGHDVGQCRPPMGPAPDGLEDRARQVLANLR
jgi:4-hydroxy-tetrahydrodipicolinate synthase